MALTSPGVQVSVIDESFYTPSEPGTTPMIFVASASNKANAGGTGTAQGTLKANAGKPFLLTSQRDLADTFGDPVFQIDSNNNPIHGSELNEYGLQAAYSLLGVSNRAFVVRADVDLNELAASATAPAADPTDGTYWLDTDDSLYGIQQWNGEAITTTGGQQFTNKVPLVITDSTQTESGSLVANGYAGQRPKDTVGAIGDYAVVATSTLNRIYYRNSNGAWVLVGSDAWTKSWATVKGSKSNPTFAAPRNITINGTTVAIGSSDTVSDVVTTINGLLIQGVTAAVVDTRLEIYSDGSGSASQDSTLAGDILIGGDADGLTELGITAGTYFPISYSTTYKCSRMENSGYISHPTGSVWIKTTEPNAGAKLNVKEWSDPTKFGTKLNPMYDTNAAAL